MTEGPLFINEPLTDDEAEELADFRAFLFEKLSEIRLTYPLAPADGFNEMTPGVAGWVFARVEDAQGNVLSDDIAWHGSPPSFLEDCIHPESVLQYPWTSALLDSEGTILNGGDNKESVAEIYTAAVYVVNA